MATPPVSKKAPFYLCLVDGSSDVDSFVFGIAFTGLDYALIEAADYAKRHKCSVLLMQTLFGDNQTADVRICKVSP